MGAGASVDDPDRLKAFQDAEAGDDSGIDDFAKRYWMGKKLGAGAFSEVFEGVCRTSEKHVAVKRMKKDHMSKEDEESLRSEATIMGKLSHPNITTLLDFTHEGDHYYMVLELVDGGELFDHIIERDHYDERTARDFLKVLIGAMQYMHSHKVVHRDMKPENVLMIAKGDDIHLKIADFGFARELEAEKGQDCTTACGTPGYVAPEIIRSDPYGVEVDMWAVGVITFILLCGYPPFHDKDQVKLFEQIVRCEPDYDDELWDHATKEARSFVSGLLCLDRGNRMDATAALAHPWLHADDHFADGPSTHLLNVHTKISGHQADQKGAPGAVVEGLAAEAAAPKEGDKELKHNLSTHLSKMGEKGLSSMGESIANYKAAQENKPAEA